MCDILCEEELVVCLKELFADEIFVFGSCILCRDHCCFSEKNFELCVLLIA